MAFRGFTRRFRRAEVLRGGPLRAALRALLNEDYEQAEEALTGLVREDSRDVEAYLGLASLYRRRGEVGRAIQVHQNLLLRADLTSEARVEALAGLASDFQQGGFQRRASAAYEEVLVYDSRNVAALRGLLAVLRELGEFEHALEIHTRLARVTRATRGRSAGPAGSSDSPVLQDSPEHPDAEVALLTRMAEAAHADGDADRARKLLKRALRKNSRFVPARVLQGELEVLRGKNKAALAAWQQVAEIGGAAATPIYPKLAAAFATQERSRRYESFLRGLIERRPDDCALGIALARALAERGEVDAAIHEIRRLLDLHPRHLGVRVALGQIILSDSQQSREAEANKEYAELLEVLVNRNDFTPPETVE